MTKFLMLTACFMSIALQASAQSARDEAFDRIGKGLDQLQRDLSQAQAGGQQTVSVGSAAPIYTSPTAAAATGLTLQPNSPVQVLGIENGFWRAVPQNPNWDKGPIYLRSTDLTPSFVAGSAAGTMASSALSSAINQIKTIASDLDKNPFVRLKGFKVSISIPPAVDLDFEMKEGAANNPSATPAVRP